MSETVRDALCEMEPSVRSIPRSIIALQAFMFSASKADGLEKDACEGLYELLAPIYEQAYEIEKQWERAWKANEGKRS